MGKCPSPLNTGGPSPLIVYKRGASQVDILKMLTCDLFVRWSSRCAMTGRSLHKPDHMHPPRLVTRQYS